MSSARTLVVPALLLLAAGRASAAAEAEGDAVAEAWRGRAALAGRKLVGPGLDACDRAVESAFQHPTERVAGRRRMFQLIIEVGEQAMGVVYIYTDDRLDSFHIVALPLGWLAYQKVDSKTLTVLTEKCALDLCTNDPTADGPCREADQPRKRGP